jgi:metallophosphoesterase (TIGR00282 family)
MFVRSYLSEEFFEKLPTHLLPKEQSIRILMVGDVIGRPGRKVLKSALQDLRKHAPLDFVTINGENIAGGFGITEKIYREMMESGVDVVTMGNHWADKADIHRIRRTETRVVLPQNLVDINNVEKIPEFALPERNKRISILNLMGNFAMKDTYNNPFTYLQGVLPYLKDKVASGHHIILLDMHAEANSEKQAAVWYLDGVLCGMIGTHTHTPTSDERVTELGTAFLSDVGMTGPYDSVIGMNKEISLKRLIPPGEKRHQEVGEKDLWFCGFLIEACVQTGLALAAHRLQYRESLDTWIISTVKKPVPKPA